MINTPTLSGKPGQAQRSTTTRTLDRFAPGLSDGDRVTKGRVLGFVGTTGNATGTAAHLHYEIHPRGGAAVPPVPHLDRWLAETGESVAMLTAVTTLTRISPDLLTEIPHL